jgi:membrane-bound lytic murein transglycosylase F
MRVALLILCSVLLGTCARPPGLLEEVLTLGELRVVTRNSPTTYYIGSNGPEGPEYDLIKGFATFLGVELKLQAADSFAGLLTSVESGRAHVAAAGLTVTPERAKRIDFGPSYQEVRQYLIYKLGNGRPRDIDQLAGKKLEVVAGTSYVETLRNVQSHNPNLIWTENPNTDVADLLLGVSTNEIDYTVADSTLFDLYRNFVPEIRVGFELTVADSLAWAFPKRHDPSLILRAEQYLAYIKENGDLARIMDRYYGHTQRFDYVGTRRFIRDYSKRFPRYKEMFQTAAEEVDMDWRLLAAIGYQESHWNPEAISPTGVRGIMMLTRDTASFIGVDDRIDPAASISGGATYLAQMKRRFAAAIDEPDRTWFALAAYNVGYGHLQDARRITREKGEDANRWIYVKDNLPLLTQRKWYSKTKHGYARGWEPVMYVENVRNYYDIIAWLASGDEALEDPDNTDESSGNTIAKISIPPPETGVDTQL